MIPLRLATTNAGKLREIRQMLEPLGYQVLGMEDLQLEIVENGATFAENAAIKARAVCNATSATTVADDSGLEVRALNDRPGVFSARYAGVAGSERDVANRKKLLHELTDVPDGARGARFVCAMALCDPDGAMQTFDGVLEGEIIREERGENGFGYDPVFLIPEYDRTAAEISPQEKNAVSHRGKAVRQLEAFLRSRS